MANKPISDNTAFPFETNVRLIDGIAGFKTGTPNTNTKISGPALVTSVINSNGSGTPSTSTVGRLAFYGLGGNSLGGSGGLNWDNPNYTLIIGNSSFKGALEIFGNYDTGNTQPRITLHGGENVVPNNFDFIITTAEDAVDQTWILPNTLPAAGQVLEANGVSTSNVTLSWVTPTDNNTTYDLGTSASGVLGQIDLIPSSGVTDSVTLTGAGTVSVSSDAVGNITITGAGGGGGFPSSITASSATPTAAAVDTFYTITTTVGVPDIEVTLPTAVGNSGEIIGVKYAGQNSVDDTVVIKTVSSQTIDGTNRTTNGLPLASLNTYYELISDGSNWFIK